VLALRSITVAITQQQQMDGVLLYLSKHGQHVECVSLKGQVDSTVSLRQLHQAAVLALHSITADVPQQQQVDDVLLYLSKHGQHVECVHLKGQVDSTVSLRQLPHNLQLGSLQIDWLNVQLQPGDGFEGVLGAAARAAALRQLRLNSCKLPYGNDGAAEGLAAALSLLPAGLEHLSVRGLVTISGGNVEFSTAMLQLLQQLTYLELADMRLLGPDPQQPALQPLQALTRLVDLRLTSVFTSGSVEEPGSAVNVTASMLTGMHNLTCLHLSSVGEVEPGAVAGKSKLQLLKLCRCNVSSGTAGVSELLSHLQQLTHLTVSRTLTGPGAAPAAAYSALTASSTLQHLDICLMALPAGAWQHMFPVGRQLAHLQYLNISSALNPEGDWIPAPECSSLVSCCPSLQELDLLIRPQCKPQLLAPLQGLTGLHTLHMGGDEITADEVQAAGQLTGLRELTLLTLNSITAEVLLPLTELLQLTALRLRGTVNGSWHMVELTDKVG
jgi:hypothetical protein